MRNIKDYIVRRRPTEPTEHAADRVGLGLDPAVADTEQAPSPQGERMKKLLADDAMRQAATNTSYNREQAIAAKEHVPQPAMQCTNGSARTRRIVPANPAPDTRQIRPKVWDMEAPQSAPSTSQPAVQAPIPEPEPQPTPAPAPAPQVPEPAFPELAPGAPRQARQSSRAKTRLLGFHGDAPVQDIFALSEAQSGGAEPRFPIGWLVVIDGPGRGASFTLTAGLSTVGRDAGQTVSLDFGDSSISRENHVAIAYDEEDRRCFIGHGGKSNIVRKNDKPLLTTEDLNGGDTIRIGKTTLRYVAFCDDAFDWSEDGAGEGADG